MSTDLDFAPGATQAMVCTGIDNNADGTETLYFRSPDPRGTHLREFVRALISK